MACMLEWHWEKNGDLTPETARVTDKVWWMCTANTNCGEGCTIVHEWPATIAYRFDADGNPKSGCPFCATGGNSFCPCNSLQARFPLLVAEWDFAKNKYLTKPLPNQYSFSSSVKVNWICGECEHEYQARIDNRTRVDSTGCPRCRGMMADRRLIAITLEWNWEKNGDLTPETARVHDNVWWLCTTKATCSEGCTFVHEWPATIADRFDADGNPKNGCPFCASRGNSFCGCSSLEARFPVLCTEWNFEKNSDLLRKLPSEYSHASNVKVHWICGECEHEYDAKINNRTSTNASGCPMCRNNKGEAKLWELLSTSPVVKFHEKRSIRTFDKILGKMRTLTPDALGVTVNGNKIFIELDGKQHFEVVYYFGGVPSNLRLQICSDLAKNRWAADNGYSVLRVAYTDFKDLEFWVNTFLDKCSKTLDPVMIPTNPEMYNNQRNIPI